MPWKTLLKSAYSTRAKGLQNVSVKVPGEIPLRLHFPASLKLYTRKNTLASFPLRMTEKSTINRNRVDYKNIDLHTPLAAQG